MGVDFAANGVDSDQPRSVALVSVYTGRLVVSVEL